MFDRVNSAFLAILTLAALFFFTLSVSDAQTKKQQATDKIYIDEVTYIDINEGNARIDFLSKNISTLQQENNDLEAKVDANKTRINENLRKIAKLKTLQESLKKEGNKIREYLRLEVIDKTSKEKAQTALNDNENSNKKAASLISKLESDNFQLNLDNESMDKKLRDNNHIIKLNETEIKNIRMSINRSSNRVRVLENHINTNDSLRSEVDSMFEEANK